jgi:glutamate--cysteine ligase catalytic subunit
MVEATPGAPYGGSTSDLRHVERNMAVRRARISALSGAHTHPFSLVAYPFMGLGEAFTWPPRAPGGPFSRSAYVPDAVISPHPRFGALTANIRHRRGRKVEIQVPLFRDAATDMAAFTEAAPGAGGSEGGGGSGGAAATTSAPAPEASTAATRRADEAAAAAAAPGAAADNDVGPAHVPEPGHVHLDAMAFGMGCCCLQVTFQARDLAESRYLYDQLAVISPLMLALTANTPIWRGRLVDTDTRWDVISASVDCRTPAERGEGAPVGGAGGDGGSAEPEWQRTSAHADNAAAGGRRRISKSRYSSVDAYISAAPAMRDEYNDVPLQLDEGALATLRENGACGRRPLCQQLGGSAAA